MPSKCKRMHYKRGLVLIDGSYQSPAISRQSSVARGEGNQSYSTYGAMELDGRQAELS